jgi:hypothetical protein
MPAIRPLKTLFSLSPLIFAGLLLTACGNGVGVSPASSTAAAASSSSGSTPAPSPAPAPSPTPTPAPSPAPTPTPSPAPAPPAPPTSPKTGSASLSWTAPSKNTDGSPLTDLAGYHIYYGTSAGAWTSTITVLDAAETSYVVAGLASGTYYFAVVAFNADGVDSPQSNVGSKKI